MTKQTKTTKATNTTNNTNVLAAARLAEIVKLVKVENTKQRDSLFTVAALLAEAKALLTFKEWLQWAELELGYAKVWACNLVRVHEQFANQPWTSKVNMTVLTELLTACESVKEIAQACAEAGEPLTVAQIKELKAESKGTTTTTTKGKKEVEDTTDATGANGGTAGEPKATDTKKELKKASDTIVKLEAAKEKTLTERDEARVVARNLKKELADAKAALEAEKEARAALEATNKTLEADKLALQSELVKLAKELAEAKAAIVAPVVPVEAVEVEEEQDTELDLPWFEDEGEQATDLDAALISFQTKYLVCLAATPTKLTANTDESATEAGFTIEGTGTKKRYSIYGVEFTGQELRAEAKQAYLDAQ